MAMGQVRDSQSACSDVDGAARQRGMQIVMRSKRPARQRDHLCDPSIFSQLLKHCVADQAGCACQEKLSHLALSGYVRCIK